MRFSNGILFALLGCQSALVAADAGALGQFALQKLLQDGRGILGDVTIDDITSSASPRARWMSKYPDSTPLTHLNIPGIHDAATWNYTQSTQDALSGATRCDGTTRGKARVYQCQRRNLIDALGAGIRFFDFRFALDPLDARLVFWHGPALLSARADLEAVLLALYLWLDAHRSETILLSLQYERGTRENARNDPLVQRLLFQTLTSPAARAYVHQEKDALQTLGDVRGKIVLLRRFDLNDLPAEEAALPGLHLSPGKWVDNSRGFELVYDARSGARAFIEDYYYPSEHDSVEGNIEAKFEAVREHLEKAARGDRGDLYVTFSSGTHVDAVPPVYPDVMALGRGVRHGVRGVNYRLLELLGRDRGERFGVLVMDFWEEPGDLVGVLLGE
ncbi:PLC-like phosphodiesterase [Xylaria nigripes]|nr:PLC-like phosphodiesterase [Xylaria nigripes]